MTIRKIKDFGISKCQNKKNSKFTRRKANTLSTPCETSHKKLKTPSPPPLTKEKLKKKSEDPPNFNKKPFPMET
jgi:hypothetical protein